GVNQSDINDTITLGTYFIKELPYGKAVIVMDLLGFAEVNKVWDHLLIVNDAWDNHDFDKVLIAGTVGVKSAERFYFNRSAMEKIFAVIKNNNP
ncbi:MAG: hypothetical protein C4519_00005, partial [Desulfobacteraceae bacterium]